ncbi:permease prefix domain 1-containing protein [Wukongibacter baidiensis]|uniref:permease prefix domain 1-containing protein n=1 Tax=Wukongibacter baidiensis TaxID=1723361 RepID=UPI003D7FCF9D
MDTIINYLDNMFATLPKTKQIKDLREDILSNMEEKYNELKRDGKSENEAIGIVISEFGNIDELIKEFDIEIKDEKEELPILTEDEVNEYLRVNKKISNFIGIGVFLCLLGASLLILVPQLIEDGFITGFSEGSVRMISLIPFFSLIAIAVGMFVYAGLTIDKYKHIGNGFELQAHVRKSIEYKKDSSHSTYILSVIIGVMMCILSPVALFITSVINDNASSYGVVLLLLIISVAVYIFIYFGWIQISYKKLLKIEDYPNLSKENNKVISAVAAIVWPLAVIIFLITGLIFNQWHINWIVFPITGLLFAMFSGAYTSIKEKN